MPKKKQCLKLRTPIIPMCKKCNSLNVGKASNISNVSIWWCRDCGAEGDYPKMINAVPLADFEKLENNRFELRQRYDLLGESYKEARKHEDKLKARIKELEAEKQWLKNQLEASEISIKRLRKKLEGRRKA